MGLNKEFGDSILNTLQSVAFPLAFITANFYAVAQQI